MKLKSLSIQKFRRFKEKAIHFTPQINILYGENEQGKTTVLLALLAALYADVNTTDKKFLQKIYTWNSAMAPSLTLEYEVNGENFVLERDFSSKVQKLTSDKRDVLATDAGTIREFVKEHTGFINADLYKLTALVEQDDIALIGSRAKNLQEGVQEALTGTGHISIEDVLKNLGKKQTELNLGRFRPAKNNGIIKSLEIEQRELSQKVAQVRGYLDGRNSSVKVVKETTQSLDQILTEIERLQKLLKHDSVRIQAEKELEDIDKLIKQNEHQISEIERKQIELQTRQKELEALSPSHGLSQIRQRVEELDAVIKNKKVELAQLEKDNSKSTELYNKRVFVSKLTGISTGIISMIIGLIVGFLTSFLIPLIILSAFVSSLCMFFFFYIYPKQLQTLVKSQDEKIHRQKLVDFEKEREELLDKSDVGSFKELIALDIKIKTLTEDLGKTETAFKTLTAHKSLEKLKSEQSDLLSRKRELEINVLTQEIRSSIIPEDEKFETQNHLNHLLTQKDGLTRTKMKAQAIKETSEYSYDDLVSTQEKLEVVNSELDYYVHKAETLEQVATFIGTARDEVINSSSSILAEYIERFLPVITNGRYHKVKIDSNLQVQVFADEKSDWIVPDDILSRGTVDQIYFIVRLAILSIISGNCTPPIILDDPFVTFDAQRRNKTPEILNKLSDQFQIILLTCHKDYNSWGNEIIL